MADGHHAAGHHADLVNPIQVQKFLSGVDYPGSKQDLINKAKAEGADDKVIQTLQSMPGDTFNSVKDVASAIEQEE